MSQQYDNVVNFFTRYRNFKNVYEGQRLNNFIAQFQPFTSSFQQLKEKVTEENKRNAPAFNIFSILGLAHYEVRTHSAFLAHLLNPAAEHGQRHLFLQSFLTFCSQQFSDFSQLTDSVENGRWQIITELHTTYGNLDIVIRSPELSYLCVIENKIYAGEQQDQLQRYSDWMTTVSKEYTEQALMYLTLSGAAASTSGKATYFRLSYRDHITEWLRQTQQQISAPSVKAVVAQYIDLIPQL
ncbi:MAG TPA: hypothetical protein EYP90_10745 [Chromatiaceae bacterium]|nr:hypothetical protein [Chromatiaceae bacterium]